MNISLAQKHRYLAFLITLDLIVFLIALPIALHYETTLRAIVAANLAVATANVTVALLNISRIGR